MVLISAALAFWISQPSTQSWLIKKTTSYLSNKLNTEVSIESVDADLFQKLILENVLIRDKQKDTLLFAHQLKLNLTDVVLLDKKFTLNHIQLNDVKLNVYKPKGDTVFNYQFIIDAFASGEKSNSSTTNFNLKLKKINLQNIVVNYNDADEEILNTALNQLDINVEKLDFKKKLLSVESVYINSPKVNYTLNSILIGDKKTTPKVDTTKADTTKKLWNIQVEKIQVEKGSFNYCVKTNDTTHYSGTQINPNDLRISGIYILAKDILLSKNNYTAELQNLEMQGQSGFSIQSAHGKAFYKNKDIAIKNLLVQTMYSKIEQNIEVHLPDEKIIHPEKIKFSAEVKNSFIHPNDLKHFVAIPDWIEPIRLSGSVSGKLGKIKSKKIEMQMGNNFFRGDFDLNGLPDVQNTFINFNVNQFSSTGNDVLKILPATKHPELLQRLGNLFFEGSFSGFLHDFVAQGSLKTSLGDVTSDVNMKITSGNQINYMGSVEAASFNLGEWINDKENVGKITLSANVDGKRWLNDNPEVMINGKLQQFEYNKYNYSDVELKGTIKQKQFVGSIISKDENVAFNFDGLVNFFDAVPTFKFNADVKNIDFKKLNFSKEDFNITNAKVKIDASGNTIDNFEGSLALSELKFKINHKNHLVNNFTASSINIQQQKKLNIHSDFLNVDVDGKFNYAYLPTAVKQILHQYFPLYIQLSNDDRESIAEQNFKFKASLIDNENYLSLLIPGLIINGRSTINGNLNTAENKLSVYAKFNQIQLGDKYFNPLVVNAEGNKQKLFANITCNTAQLTDSLIIHDSKFHVTAMNDSLLYNYTMAGDKNEIAFNINGLTILKNENIKTHFFESEIFVKGYQWLLMNDNLITYENNYFDFKDVVLLNQNQKIEINTDDEATTKDNIKINFSNIDLSQILDIAGGKDAQITGRFNAVTTINNYASTPNFESSIDIKNCFVGKDTIGNITGIIKYDEIKKAIYSNVDVQQGINKMKLSGNYKLNDTANYLDYQIVFHHFNLKTIEPAINTILSHKEGNLTGTAKLSGSLKKPKIEADVNLYNGALTVNYLNTHYKFETVHATCNNNIIKFDKFILMDTFNNKGEFVGSINLNNMHAVWLDMHVKTNRLLVNNTTLEQNELFFGKAFASGNIDLTGITYNLTIAAKAKTLKGTQLYIPITDDRDLKRHDFIQFVNHNQTEAAKQKKYVADLDGLTLKFDIDAVPEAEINILMDLVAGDYIKGYGNGNIKIDFSSNTAFSMLGSYTMDRGEYHFTLFNFPKDFNINAGSTITWNGDAYNGILDVVGTYSARASFYELVKDLLVTDADFAASRIRVPIQVKTDLKGSLKKPDVAFDISPTNTSSTAIDFKFLQRLQAVKSDQNELNNQVFALIAMNSFIAPQNVGGFDNPLAYNSTYKQSSTELISSQVSRLLSNAFYRITKDDKTQFNINYKLYDQSQDARNFSQFNINLSRRFLKDRLTIEADGLYDYGATTTNNNNGFVGNFLIEYNLTPDGRIKIKGFRKTEYDVLNERNRNRTGLGLAYKREFNSLSEFFEKSKKTKIPIWKPKL
ncbi:MAG: hypothetical protein RL065_2253 [Bacteroidota bacterium]